MTDDPLPEGVARMERHAKLAAERRAAASADLLIVCHMLLAELDDPLRRMPLSELDGLMHAWSLSPGHSVHLSDDLKARARAAVKKATSS